MPAPVIVEAVRSPIGRRGKGLAEVHPADLLAHVQRAAIERSGVDPADVDQVIGGCVSQVGEQGFNIARTAWLAAGFPQSVPATTIDAQCGSSQQALHLAVGLIGSGQAELVLVCGVEMMSRVPLTASAAAGFGRPLPASYDERYERASQFQAAERIAAKWNITRADADAFGLRSQQLAAQAWADGRFTGQVAPLAGVDRDEGLRETTADGLSALAPVLPDGVHTPGSSSQISDGAAAVLVASESRASSLGVPVLARVAATSLVGVDPVLMLTGPIDATARLLAGEHLSASDIDLYECNEAFASIPLAWQRELSIPEDRVNVNGGAIALGHPAGSTGARLITTAVHELRRRGGGRAVVTMCCGGGLGTATLLETG
jgi:acetyl-CoA C-acetyltransferase